MAVPKTLHQGMIDLLRKDKRLAIELAHAAAGLPPLPAGYEVREHTNNAELRKLLSRDELRQLYPDLIFSVHDHLGRLVEVWIFEVQIDRDDTKEFAFPAYVASVQIFFQHHTRLVGISPKGATRRWLIALGLGPICRGTTTAGLQLVTGVCNPDASWLLDRAAPGPEESPEALQRELELARRRPHAALLNAVHHSRDMRARMIVLAALLAARELGAAHFHRYTTMVLNSASKAMNVYLHRELARVVPEEELSEFEREGAGFLKGHEEGLEQGLERGLQRGRAIALGRAILDILQLRGLTPPTKIRARVQGCRDLDQLEQWYARAMQATSLAEVFAPTRRATSKSKARR